MLATTLATLGESCPACVTLRGAARCRDMTGFSLPRLGQCLPPGTHILNMDDAGIGPLGPNSFRFMPSLRSLEMSDNPVNAIHEDALQDLFRLESFSCRNCSLEFLEPNTFVRTPRLVELDLSWNHLRSLSEELLQSLVGLRVLRVLRNHLHVLSPSWLKGRQGLTLRAEGNLWHCDCQAYYMMMAVAVAGVDQDISLDVCESPIHYRGALLKALVKGTCP